MTSYVLYCMSNVTSVPAEHVLVFWKYEFGNSKYFLQGIN